MGDPWYSNNDGGYDVSDDDFINFNYSAKGLTSETSFLPSFYGVQPMYTFYHHFYIILYDIYLTVLLKMKRMMVLSVVVMLIMQLIC